VNAGLAFGTGAHETTRLCLESIERHMTLGAGKKVMDVGTGSGILSEAALKLGAEKVFACDTDHGAVIVARENLARAGMTAPVFVGSADSVASGWRILWWRIFLRRGLRSWAGEWLRILRPGGWRF